MVLIGYHPAERFIHWQADLDLSVGKAMIEVFKCVTVNYVITIGPSAKQIYCFFELVIFSVCSEIVRMCVLGCINV